MTFVSIVFFTQNNIKRNEVLIISLPKSTKTHFLINGNSFLNELVFDELFQHKDDLIIEKIKELIKNQKQQKKQLSDISLNLSRPIEIIQLDDKEDNLLLLKYTISNVKIFDKNLKKRQVPSFRIKETGYLILNKFKINLTKTKNIFNSNLFYYKLKNNVEKHFFSRFQSSKLLSRSSIQFKNHDIIFETFSSIQTKNNIILEPKGFHFSTSIELNKSKSFDNEILKIIKLTDLNFISCNFLGIRMTDDLMIPVIPKFEVLFSYKNPIEGNAIIIKLLKQLNININQLNNDEYEIADQRIKIIKLDKHQFIVSTISDSFKLKKIALNPYLTGNPKNLLLVENAGWKNLLLELVPSFKATKSFLDNSLQVTTTKNEAHFQRIIFKFNRKESLHEVLKIVLNIF